MRIDRTRSVIELLRDHAAARPGDRAFTFLDDGEREGACLSWAQLERRSRAIGVEVARRVEPGARVLVMFPPSLDFVPAFLGVLSAGGVAVPAYPPAGGRADRTIERLRGMIGDSGVRLVVGPADLCVRADVLAAALPELCGLPWLDPACISDDLAEEWRQPALTDRALAFLQYTSGSTSAPRGVMVSHANLLHNLAETHRGGCYSQTSVSVSWLPVNHDMGLINGVLQSVFSGCPAFLMAPAAFLQRPARWLQAISRYGATHSGGPNFAYDLSVRRVNQADAATLDLSSWLVAYNGSEPVRRATLEAFHARFGVCGFKWEAFSPAYGLAEATLLVASIPPGAPPWFRGDAVACGVLSDTVTRVLIVDPATRRLVPDTVVGEIWVSGESVAHGYWKRPAQTAETFAAFTADGRGPFLRTGDLGFLDRGRLFVAGRLKDVLIVRGVKHHPHDIELTAERAHPALRPGCCAAVSVQADGEEQVAIVAEIDSREQSRAEGIDPAQIMIAVRIAIASAHHISTRSVSLVRAGALPKTTSGKLQRFLCREALVGGTLELLAAWTDDAMAERAAS
jgi:acyl-CoA synthetase (AMP-forming)/AMP-acid ligase II